LRRSTASYEAEEEADQASSSEDDDGDAPYEQGAASTDDDEEDEDEDDRGHSRLDLEAVKPKKSRRTRSITQPSLPSLLFFFVLL
jgi:hypothetical protein